jgi:hypothetical protein
LPQETTPIAKPLGVPSAATGRRGYNASPLLDSFAGKVSAKFVGDSRQRMAPEPRSVDRTLHVHRGIAMKMTYRLSVVLLSTMAVVLVTNSQSALGQRFKISGGSSQSDKDKKDKDSDDENKDRKKDKDKDKDDQNNQGGNSNKSEKSGPLQIQPFIKNGPGQNGQGQGGSNKTSAPFKVAVPGQFQQQQQGQTFQDDDDHKNTLKFGMWKGDQWQGPRKIDSWSKVFGNNKQPFSSQWYKDHPQAWKYDNNKSNVWVVATVPGVYSWLGWGNVPPQYGVGFNNGPQFDPSRYGDWYPLGVYSLMTGPDDMGTRVVQLAVDRHGHVAGNYYDMITDSDHGVSGEVQRQTQRVEWTLNKNPNVRFRSSIMRLLQPYGSVTVQLPGGQQRWQFVRLEN